jgi:SH3-like domain-containing protein
MMKTLVIPAVFVFMFGLAAADVYGLCIKASTANVRKGPGTRYETGWTVYKYMPFKKVGTSLSGDWYAVEDIDNEVFWVHKSLVTGKMRCAAATTDVSIRTGPGTHYKKLLPEPVEKYYCFRILSQKGQWVHVRDEANNIGWIHRDYLWIQ